MRIAAAGVRELLKPGLQEGRAGRTEHCAWRGNGKAPPCHGSASVPKSTEKRRGGPLALGAPVWYHGGRKQFFPWKDGQSMIIKCKMCGGDIEFTPGATYGTCEYCGSTSTIPKADDEGRLNLFNRANSFRRKCEFDKAVAAYEKILEQDDTDAEAHWGVVISRYGIEYVEDPATGKRIPTCHRVQLTSILADEDYKAAVQHAPDAESRRLYEEEAARIAEIQRGILAISQNEKPYDVFICYKETDESGQRTHDSQWAQEVYYGLTEQGYKVFFSRITLEDKLGQEYEPYIFAALNSARVMIVIGSKPEYFNAVWVKNEWSRYLALMANDRKRLLIPCYRGMDPYDLPDELSSLQSQDMSKIGFMQDLLRGVKKVLDAEKKPVQAAPVQPAAAAPEPGEIKPGVSSLMERTALFLEDGDFDSAAQYIDRVLDLDPKYAPAYVGKMCVSFRLRKEEDLARTTFLFEDNPDWKKALRFATPQQRAVYADYATKVRKRVAAQIRDYAYDCAIEMAITPDADRGQLDAELDSYKDSCTWTSEKRPDGRKREASKKNRIAFAEAIRTGEPGAVSEQSLKTAAEMFEKIKDEEAALTAKECRRLAEQARKKVLYNYAVEMHRRERGVPSGLEKTAKLFISAQPYRDAKAQAQRCLSEAEAVRAGYYDTAIRTMNSAGYSSTAWSEVKRKLAISDLDGYRDIDKLRDLASKRCEECIATELEAKRQAEEIARRAAERKKARNRTITIVVFSFVSLVIVAVCAHIFFVQLPMRYNEAVDLQKAGKYEEAIAAFKKLNGFRDSAEQIVLCETSIKEGSYEAAMALQKSGRFEEAITAFEMLNGFRDSSSQIIETKYLQACSLKNQGKFAEAYSIYVTISEYKDVDTLLKTDQNLIAIANEARLRSYKNVGGCVTFGSYPQTSTGNDMNPVEWIVLDYDSVNNWSFLISRYGLDAQPYNNRSKDVTWENCSLRKWLNETFLNRAFSIREQTAILLIHVDNSNSQGYSNWNNSSENNTQDRIFLLSYAEANKYLQVVTKANTKSRVSPTAYALNAGAPKSNTWTTTEGDAAGWWWLRSPGYGRYNTLGVLSDGSLSPDRFISDIGCVRPAMWIDLDSEYFQ